ncbi:hypothetical protein Tco_0938394 [Tanacetum coccineum]|uniref:Uncharacterized protein n=1 Tax=Tanacetum coccineum TaxID=301880 RepID=A0ABQ5DP14_9ASTR
MIVSIEESRHGPSDAMHKNSFPALKRNLSHLSRRYTRYLLTSHSEIDKRDGVAAPFQRSRIHRTTAILKLSKAQVDQGSQIKMIQVKEMMQDNDLKNSKSKDKGSKSRSQSMDEQSHYKQDKTITRQSINVKRHIFNVIGGTEEFEERDLNIGGDC